MERQKTLNYTVREAGAAGGLTTYIKYGREHFREIGKQGQAALSAKISSEQRRLWGALGGRPKTRRFSVMGEKEKQD
jgi:hypothetical protein